MKKLLKVLPVVMVVCLAFTSIFAVTELDDISKGVEGINSDIEYTIQRLIQRLTPEWAIDASVEIFIFIYTVGFLPLLIISVLIFVLTVICNFILYRRAGKLGIAALVPIYTNVIQFRIVGLSPLFLLLLFVPVVQYICWIAFGIIIPLRFAKSYGKGIGFGLGLVFFPVIFKLILVFSKSEYIGPNGEQKKCM